MKPSQLNNSEFDPYFSTYINLVDEVDGIEALKISRKTIIKTFESIALEKHEYRYSEGKWTIKELLLHLIDTERIFINRALRFARKDKTNLPGYDHNVYVDHSNANRQELKKILKAYKAQRKSSILFFKSLDKEMLKSSGTANEKTLSVRAIGYIIAGHDLHHCSIVKERYL